MVEPHTPTITVDAGEPDGLVTAGRLLADRIKAGATLLVHGRGARAEDARHVAVEFTHPVIVGKRAVPAVAVVTADDLAILGRSGDVAVVLDPAPDLLTRAEESGVDVITLPAAAKDDLVASYHLLWELTQLFLDGESAVSDPDLAFLYGTVGEEAQIEAATTSLAAKREEIANLRRHVLEANTRTLDQCGAAIAERVAAGARVLVAGNGGSQTDAAALTIELRRRNVAAVNLSENPAVLTALGNDVGFEAVFARQVAALGRAGDVLIVLSTSGGSPNVLAALAEATERGLYTVGFAGYDGGSMAVDGLAGQLFVVPSTSVHRIQEAQTSLYLDLAARVGAA